YIAMLGPLLWSGCIIGADLDKLTGGGGNSPAPGGGNGPAPGGGSQTNMAPSGTGYTWSRNRTSTSDANRSAGHGINDGDLAAGASGLLGARVTGETGQSSWSWIVNEVQLLAPQ